MNVRRTPMTAVQWPRVTMSWVVTIAPAGQVTSVMDLPAQVLHL